MSKIGLTYVKNPNTEAQFIISGSKSISQRVLIINYLSDFNKDIENLSNSDDTNVLYNALCCGDSIIDVKHSGTALRFLISVFALKKTKITLTGSKYLFNRPVMPLIESLNSLGASISKNENKIYLKTSNLVGSVLNLDCMYTSQFISSLLLISPYLKNGITLNLPKKIYSKSYIDMTVALMKKCGAKIIANNNIINVSNHKYSSNLQFIESDWTSASYLFLAFLFSKLNVITISKLYPHSMQKDQVIVDFFALLGVITVFENNGSIILKKITNVILPSKIEWNFINNPDLFPTIAVACCGLGVKLVASGLRTLAYKESNRIIAMQSELSKFNCIYHIESKDVVSMKPKLKNNILNEAILIDTHNDHRIALAFSPLVLLGWKLKICNPEVINKSYRNFWHDLRKFGIEIKCF